MNYTLAPVFLCLRLLTNVENPDSKVSHSGLRLGLSHLEG